VGYVGKRTRTTSRFVRYPYPKQLYSNYKINYGGSKHSKSEYKHPKEAFNLEKETKIINPHPMEKSTMNKEVFKGEKGEKALIRKQETLKEAKPIVSASSY